LLPRERAALYAADAFLRHYAAVYFIDIATPLGRITLMPLMVAMLRR